MSLELLIQYTFLISLTSLSILAMIGIYLMRNAKIMKTSSLDKLEQKPVHERALSSRFITGLHLALLFDGFDWEPTWHGLKYTGDLIPEPLEVFVIFGSDWKGSQFDEAFVEIQINKRTLNIEKVRRFHWSYYKEMLLYQDYEKYLDLYESDEKE